MHRAPPTAKAKGTTAIAVGAVGYFEVWSSLLIINIVFRTDLSRIPTAKL